MIKRVRSGIKKLFNYLIGRLPHELFGLLPPYGGDCDHPADLVRGHLVAEGIGQFTEGVVSEVPERSREHKAGGHGLPVGGTHGGRPTDFLEKKWRKDIRLFPEDEHMMRGFAISKWQPSVSLDVLFTLCDLCQTF